MLDAETLEIQSSIAFADYKTRLRFDSGYQNDSKWSWLHWHPKKAIRCDIVRTRKKGRSVVCYDETDCVRNTNFRLDIETNILNLTWALGWIRNACARCLLHCLFPSIYKSKAGGQQKSRQMYPRCADGRKQEDITGYIHNALRLHNMRHAFDWECLKKERWERQTL
jgi:integrase